MYRVHYRDGSTDEVSARSAAAARKKGEADYGEVASVVILSDVVAEDEDDEDEEEEEDEGE